VIRESVIGCIPANGFENFRILGQHCPLNARIEKFVAGQIPLLVIERAPPPGYFQDEVPTKTPFSSESPRQPSFFVLARMRSELNDSNRHRCVHTFGLRPDSATADHHHDGAEPRKRRKTGVIEVRRQNRIQPSQLI